MPAGKIETREGFITDVFRLRPPPQPQTTEAPLPPSVPRPDLAAIELTLPTADPEEEQGANLSPPDLRGKWGNHLSEGKGRVGATANSNRIHPRP